jgi:hypothetical protein
MSNNETNPNESAFAKSAFYHPEGGIDSPQLGLTKREYFAGLIMQGLLANPNNDGNPKYAAKHSVECSEELIKALNNEQ